MKNAPMRKVSVYHSRSPQRRGLNNRCRIRLTWPRSAAKTPIWQVKELATSTLVLTMANGMLIRSPWICQSGHGPGQRRLATLVTFRIVK